VCVPDLKVPVDEFVGVSIGELPAAQCVVVNFGERVVKTPSVAEALVDRRIEPVQQTQLELVWTLEEVLEVAERQLDIDQRLPRRGREARRRAWRRLACEKGSITCELLEKDRRLLVQPVVRIWGPGAEQVLLGTSDRDVHQPALVFLVAV